MPGCSPDNLRRLRYVIAAGAIFFVVIGGASTVLADDKRPYDDREALAISQAAVGRTLSDFTFTDRQGQPYEIARLRGKPALISRPMM